MFRSALYVPGDHQGAMVKAASLKADILIFDLEDGVSPEHKAQARTAIATSLNQQPYEPLTLVRINHCSSPHYSKDIAAIAACAANGLMLSKVGSQDEIQLAADDLAKHDRADMPIWCNVETALGVLNIAQIASHPKVTGIVLGTNDLRKELNIPYQEDRSNLMHCIQHVLLGAKAFRKTVLDGTFIRLDDEAGLKAEALQGKQLGFDGKTLIHPKQIEVTHQAFMPSEEELTHAQAIITCYERARKEQKAVALLNGTMIEALHYIQAQKLIAASKNH